MIRVRGVELERGFHETRHVGRFALKEGSHRFTPPANDFGHLTPEGKGQSRPLLLSEQRNQASTGIEEQSPGAFVMPQIKCSLALNGQLVPALPPFGLRRRLSLIELGKGSSELSGYALAGLGVARMTGRTVVAELS